jgi:hypothetical protein
VSAADIDTNFARVSREPTDMIDHMPTIKRYSQQCSSAVEFGVYDCTSTWALLAGHPQKLTSYDIERRVEVNDVELAAKDSGTTFQFVLADSAMVEIDEVDLLFIDSMHTYEHLNKELALHHSRVKKYVILHDTTTFGAVGQTGGRGLWVAVEEFLETHKEWRVVERYTNCHGLTILGRAA